MGMIGISLLVASVVYLLVRPVSWLPENLLRWTGIGGAITDHAKARAENDHQNNDKRVERQPNSESKTRSTSLGEQPTKQGSRDQKPPRADHDAAAAKAAMPPPSIPTIQPPAIEEPEESTTPKASATKPAQPVPTFSLTGDEPAPAANSPSTSSSSPSAMMPPPPLPGRLPQAGRVPTLPMFPAANSAQRARGPVPNRGPPNLSAGGLAPPPTHSSKPQKPSRKVTLDPGHSPLDWARISGPNADLRGVPSSTPYLRVTPSMLKKQTGRKGKDAWMAINGKVYNITPYAKFHPGGVPELMRGAARDGTKLFGEIHPWVNYETMLSACLVGLLVEEPEGNSQESEMDRMD